MQTLASLLQQKFTIAIKKAFGNDISLEESQAEVVFSNEGFGDYQCNNAMKISKILKKSPRDVAAAIIQNLDPDTKKIISNIEIAGPGFINIFLDTNFLSSELNHSYLDPHLGAHIKKSQRIVIDFSSPNVAKQLHVGHLRSTIIGDSLARLFEFLGNDVLRLNHVGDWGTQFGMLIAYMKEHARNVLSGKEKTDLVTLETWYKQSKKRFDEDEVFKKASQNEVVKLQGGEKEALKAWQIICDISRAAYQEIYDLLDVKIIERGESFYNPILKDVVDDLEKKGLITISEGAKCVFLEGFKNREGNPMPLMVQKSDGSFNYDTTDLAAMRQRVKDENADRIIIVTDAGQAFHFKLIYAASLKAGYIDPKKTEFDHVPFGLVLGPDGKKFKTRSGETEKLIDLILGAIEKSRDVLLERTPDLNKEELEKLAKILGVDAIKYSDLSCHRLKDYHFSYDRMLRFEGNTAVFLLYSYVRIWGIKRKIKGNVDEILKTAKIKLSHPSEKALGLHLRRFGEVLDVMAKDLLPNRLCDYLFELAEKFNSFFRDCRVEGSEEQNERLVLCELTAKILKQGLNILGLKTTDRL
jgi:arginyl-tRNA synthetase